MAATRADQWSGMPPGTTLDRAPSTGASQRGAAVLGSAARRRGLGRRGVPLLIGALAAALYVRAANPAVGGGNSGEFQVMAHLMGIAHPPSYPLYLLLAKGASLVPLPGDVAWRINVLTALLGGLAVALSGSLALHLTTPAPATRSGTSPRGARRELPAAPLLAAAITAVATAAMPRLWSLAVEAEVFTLHLALVLAFWIAIIRWQRAIGGTRSSWWLAGAGLLAGLGLANHRTFLFVIAGGVLTVLLSRPWRPQRQDHPHGQLSLRLILATGALALAGLSPYLYVVRGLVLPVPYFDPGDVRRLTRQEVWYVLQGNASQETGGGTIVRQLLLDPPLLLDRSRWASRHVSAQFGPAGSIVAVAGAAGLALLLRRRPAWTTGALAGAAGAALFGMAYGKYPDADRYLLPLHVLLALGLGVVTTSGVSAVQRATRTHRTAQSWIGASAGLALAAYWAIPLSVLSNSTGFTRGGYVHHTVHNLNGVAPNSVVCSWWASSWGWWYAQFVDSHRPDVHLVPKGPDECARDVLPREFGRRPVYLPALTDTVRRTPYVFFPSRDLWLAVAQRPPLVDGALLKGPDDRIYLYHDGRRHWVPSLSVFTARGFTWEQVRLTADYELRDIPEGPILE
ncbi:MAG: DUF2723 domain-containing protein [Chloroflexota bacterium]|nr:DUF2723 domain-containing protein [Chloroflexota bacterium]